MGVRWAFAVPDAVPDGLAVMPSSARIISTHRSFPENVNVLVVGAVNPPLDEPAEAG